MTACFHCSCPMAGEAGYAVMVDGQVQPVCCAGCEAAASLILSQGLEQYYKYRQSATAPTPIISPQQWGTYDREAALRRYTHLRADGLRELSLRIDGLHCAACGWLIENSLAKLPGVSLVQVNAVNAQAQVRFDPQQIALSSLLAQISQLGFGPQPLSWDKPADLAPERRLALKRLAVAGFGMMTVMTYATSQYVGGAHGIAPDLDQLLRLVSMVVTTPVVLYAAQPFFVGAWRGLLAGTLNMDVPVAISIAAAYIWSVICTLRGSGTVYYDSAVMFTFLLLLGRYIEMTLRTHAGLEGDALARLLPQTTLRLASGGAERVLPSELMVGDRLRILPGERLAADGRVLTGRTQMDESLLTGESLPKARGVGDEVIAGSVNLSGTVEIAVTRVGQDSTLATIARLLGSARASRPQMSSVVDRVAAWFVAGVLALAAGTFIYWWHVAPERAFPIALAVLVVTCPCALSLATPAAFAAASTRLARDGLLLTRSRALESLIAADHVIFDKTGTLTQGVPRIEQVVTLSERMTHARASTIAAALEGHSEHPIAQAFAGIEPSTEASDVRVVPGSGLEGRVDGVLYRLGRQAFLWQCASPASASVTADQDARTSILLGDEHGALAAFLLSDTLRADAADTVRELHARGLTVMIASGDGAAAVESIARRVAVACWRSGMSAQAKLELVRTLQSDQHRIIMVGDGINDAPVLAAADTSAAIGTGTDLAKVSADMILLGDGCAALVAALDTAHLTFRIIRQNLTWAILYNALAVPLAVSGLLQPWMAAVGMSLSSLLVVVNAMRLIRPRRHRTRTLAHIAKASTAS